MGNRDDIIEINLGELFSVLLGRAFLIISAGIFFGLAGLFVSKFIMHPVYYSTTKNFQCQQIFSGIDKIFLFKNILYLIIIISIGSVGLKIRKPAA